VVVYGRLGGLDESAASHGRVPSEAGSLSVLARG
jgi:hypothetical protein